MQLDNLDNVIGIHGNDSSQLIGILQDIQREYNYLPLAAIMQVSERLKVPFSRLYSIATFFKAFSLQPRGRHIITVCLGTACHVRKAPRIVDEISRSLGIKRGGDDPRPHLYAGNGQLPGYVRPGTGCGRRREILREPDGQEDRRSAQEI